MNSAGNTAVRDNDEPKKDLLKNPLPKPRVEAVLLAEEPYFDYYIKESEGFRMAHGISKVGGKFIITDLDRLKSLPEWKKAKLRLLVRG